MEKLIIFALVIAGAIWLFRGGEKTSNEQPAAVAAASVEVAVNATPVSDVAPGADIFETLATWFAAGTIGFTLLILIMFVVIGILQEQYKTYPGWSSVILTFGLVLLFTANPGWWTSLTSNWFITIPVVFGLLLSFTAWAFFKWKINAWRYWHLMEGYYVVYCRENNLLSNLSVPVSLSSSHKDKFIREWRSYARSKRMAPQIPSFDDYRGRMIYWACFAPFSAISTMAQDGIGQIFSKMLDARRKSFDKRSQASREVLKGLFEDDSPSSPVSGDDTARA